MASKDSSAKSPVKILVYGTTAVGKSSLISLLTGKQAEIGTGQLKGCTFKSNDFECIHEGEKYVFTDTVGLHEAAHGTVETKDAFKSLLKLIKKAKEGFNLVIYVRKAMPLTTMDENNYNLIISNILDNQVKTMCVNTGAEQYSDTDLNKWWKDNESEFKTKMPFNCGVSVCCAQFSKNHKFNELFKGYATISKDILWNEIKRTKSSEPIPIKTSIKTMLIKAWNFTCKSLSLVPLLGRVFSSLIVVNENLKNLLKELKFTEEESSRIAADLDAEA